MAPATDLAGRDLHKVFISYSRSDFYFAEQLAVALRRRGLVVWFDVHELSPGTDWSSAIDQAIADCDTFLLIASSGALESPYVQRELERAGELSRVCVAVQPRRRAASTTPDLPTYDLSSDFGRGVDRLAGELSSGQPVGGRPRLPLPFPTSVCLVALAPALATAFAVVSGVSFARAFASRPLMFVPNTGYYVGVVVVLTTLIGVYCAYVFWAFCVRRVSWVNLRTTQVPMAILVLLTWWLVDMLAAYLTDPIENIVIALGGQPDEVFLGYGPALLALGAALTGVLAAIATSLASAVCRHLQTGVAPHRVRRRHIGGVPGSVVKRLPARTYRLIAADDDSSVANEVRRALADVGMSEVDEDEEGQRQIVVVSDRTPIDLVSDDRLTEPLAVVATSVAVPVRGVLQRFQWVDYRRRRRRTLAALGRDLAGESSGENTLTPPLPESLQKVRLPFWLRVVEWTLFAMATLATIVATYPLVQWAFTDQEPDLWPAPLCIPVAAALVTLTLMVRRRRITPGAVVAVGAVSWLVMSACGLNQVVEAMYPSTNPALSISASWAYALASAIVLVIAWRPLRRWLPRRLRWKEAEQPTLGPAAGSWPWYVAVGPLFLAFLSAAGLSTAPPDSSGNLETAAIDTCRDQTEMAAFLEPLNSANEAVQTANEATIRSAVESRIEAIGRVIDDIERYVPSGSWGADMKTRLIEGLEGMSGADRTYLDQGSVGSEAYEAVGNTVTELNGAVC